ncbi:hypothetical protein Cme02nite_65680 [Catellatospora methionotrophica]|uniref:Uncharacterized protein n=1 Tax=Catellatospora methionotrophica TaxID=121620 RepID=A0A8J3PK93_9ACTN|nr:hypothetical protein [Catellatospora methionotrophica]GIG18236.1 hypothetical protein Cme02nite_65680 [Catellatospora methionotrophica]
MSAAAPMTESRPAAVRVLAVLLALTALATASVEWLNWYYATDGGYPLFVRTAWALLRSLLFLVLIFHLWRGRHGAAPFGLILAVTTLFALARLVVPKQGVPAVPGIIGFGVVVVLCLTVVLLLYRSASVQEYLARPKLRWWISRDGLTRKPMPPRPQVPGWVLTTRVAVFSYSALMLVACVVSIGRVFSGEVTLLPVVVGWFVFALVVSYSALFLSIFLVKGKAWARWLLVLLTLLVLVMHLPLCLLMLGVDGLVRDGGPLIVAALLALWGLWRAGRNGHFTPTRPAETTTRAPAAGTRT